MFAHLPHRTLITAAAALALLVILLWLPTGIKTTGLMEEWIFLNDFEKGTESERNEDIDFITLSGTQRLRPLVGSGTVTAAVLTPGSFTGAHLYVMVTTTLKGLALYLVLAMLLPDNRVFALLTALLLIVFPADDGLFTFRALPVHGAVMYFLLGVYFLLRYWEQPRWWAALGFFIAQLITLMTYEVVYPLIAATPLLLLWHRPQGRARWIRATTLWMLAPVLTMLYVTWSLGQGESYQSWVLQRSGLTQPEVAAEMVGALVNAYQRNLIGGWWTALGQVTSSAPLLLGLAAAAGVISAGAGWLTMRGAEQHPMEFSDGARRYLGLLVIGLAVIGLGYVLFLLTPYRDLTWRVFVYSSIGGALCSATVIWLISRWLPGKQRAFVVIMSALIAVATVWALNQQAHYAALSATQQRVLRGVIRDVPQLADGGVIVVVDETDSLRDNWTLGTSYLVEYALQVIYEDYDVQAVLCAYESAAGFRTLPELQERCAFTDSGVVQWQGEIETERVPYNQMALVRYTSEGTHLAEQVPPEYTEDGVSPSGYDPQRWIVREEGLPPRYFTMFSIGDDDMTPPPAP